VLILGEDLTSVAPRMALAVRQSVRRQPMEIAETLKIPLWMDQGVREATQGATGPLFIATPYATRLDDVATATFHGAPDDLARLAFAVAHALDAQAPPLEDGPLAVDIARALKAAKNPLVISGSSCVSEALIEAAANVAMAAGAALSFTAPECNTVGAALMEGKALSEVFRAIHDGTADTVIILENDLYRRAPAHEVDAFLDAAAHVITLDHLSTPTTDKAELLLPAATFAETTGTFVSGEGRAQRYFEVFVPENDVRASWRWLGADGWKIDDVIAAIAEAIPVLAPIAKAAPAASYRIHGARIPRSPERESGRTAMRANIDVSEPKPPEDNDSPLSYSMEGTPDQPPAALIPFFWKPGWNSIQATQMYQTEVGGPLRGGDAGARIFEPAGRNGQAYFTAVPAAFQPCDGEWLLVPMYHIFGSDELSLSAAGIAELVAKPYVALNTRDIAEGAEVDLISDAGIVRLPVRIRPDLPAGVAGLFAPLPPLAGTRLPARVKIGVAT
jgi:NADH-quinone oxidoreductase subunit G